MNKAKETQKLKTEQIDYSTYLNTNIEKGLNNDEVKKRQEIFGKNELAIKKKKNPFLIYLSQFKDLLVIILLCATLLSYIISIIQGFQVKWKYSTELLISFIEPSIILFVVLTNSLIGAIQEIKSEQAIEGLKKLNPLYSKVKRNGNLISILSSEITIGDIVFLEAGDIVPADGILLNSYNLKVIESSLTGESEPIEKDYKCPKDDNLSISEKKYALFSSSIISLGTATLLVEKIGENTELGKISRLVKQEKEALTPLQIKINKLGKIFGFSGIALFLLSMLIQIIYHALAKQSFANPIFWSTIFINGISLAVAAIPEGLVAFSSVILAIGIQKMAKHNAIVKSLMAVESLGSCSIICSDKTGTLTQNKMTIVNTYIPNSKYSFSSIAKENKYLNLIEYGSLCLEANLIKEDDIYKEVGDPTEIAFLYALENMSQTKSKKELEQKYPRLFSLPFDSDRKLMSSINRINNETIVIVKGAPDILINKCINLSSKETNELKSKIQEWSNNSYRVLMIAIKKIALSNLDELKTLTNNELYNLVENKLDFIGLVAMIDPPRETSKESIKLCLKAGIRPIMITGDNINTAIAIAKELGIYREGDLAIDGTKLKELSDEELFKNIEKYSVYARAIPEDKIRIVHAWQKKNQVVAMTGDGVNDAPALKAAEIGCAMGITGTEAAKEASDMILADDNFSTVVKAVENGRSIYQKIKNVIQNLLITSIAEIILVFFGLIIFKLIFKQEIILNIKNDPNFDLYILSATQLLWINLFTHGFPAIALGLQESKENYMNDKPIPKNESIFAKGMGINTLWQGILMGILSLIGYYLGAKLAIQQNMTQKFVEYGSTAAFLILGICATFNAINLMSKKPLILQNPLFYWKVYLSVFISLFFLFIVSFINKINSAFKITSDLLTNSKLILISLGIPLILIPIYFSYKIILMMIKQHQKTKIIKDR